MPKHRATIPFERPPPLGSPRKARSEREDAADFQPFKSYYRYLPFELRFLDGISVKDGAASSPAKQTHKGPKNRRSKLAAGRTTKHQAGPGPAVPDKSLIDGDDRRHHRKVRVTLAQPVTQESRPCGPGATFALSLVPNVEQPPSSSTMVAVVDALLSEMDNLPELAAPEGGPGLWQALSLAPALAGLQVAAVPLTAPGPSITAPDPSTASLLVGLWAVEAFWPSAAPLLAHGMALVAAALAAAARQYGGGIRSARGGRWRLTFPSLPAAVDCALALQLALLTQPWDPELEAFDATATVATADGAATLFRGLRVRCAVVEGPDPPADQALRSLVSLVPGGVTVVAFPAEKAADSPCSTTNPAVWAPFGSTPSHFIFVTCPTALRARLEASKQPWPPVYCDPPPIRPAGNLPLAAGAPAMEKALASFAPTGDTRQRPTPSSAQCCALVQALGSLELWALDPVAAQASLALFHKCVRSLLVEMGGVVLAVDIDHLLASFSTASEAVIFASKLQTDLLRQSWPDHLLRCPWGIEATEDAALVFRGLRCRISIDMVGGQQLSQFLSVAREGQILLTRDVYHLAAAACEVAILLWEGGPYCIYPAALAARHAHILRLPAVSPPPAPGPSPPRGLAFAYAHIPSVAADAATATAAGRTCHAVLAYLLHVCGGAALRATPHDLLAAFPTAALAAAWGLLAQEALLGAAWPEALHPLEGARRRPLLPAGAEPAEALLGGPQWLWRGLRVAVGIHARRRGGSGRPSGWPGTWQADVTADPVAQEAMQLGSRVASGCCVISEEALHLAQEAGIDGVGLIWVKRLGRVRSWPSQPAVSCMLPWVLRGRAVEQRPLTTGSNSDGAWEFVWESPGPDDGSMEEPDVRKASRPPLAWETGADCALRKVLTADAATQAVDRSSSALPDPNLSLLHRSSHTSHADEPPGEQSILAGIGAVRPASDADLESRRQSNCMPASTVAEVGPPALWARTGSRRSPRSVPQAVPTGVPPAPLDDRLAAVAQLTATLAEEAGGRAELLGLEAAAWQVLVGALARQSTPGGRSPRTEEAAVRFVVMGETAERSYLVDAEAAERAAMAHDWLALRAHSRRPPGLIGIHPFYAKLQRLRQGYHGLHHNGSCPFRNPGDCPFPDATAVHGFAPLADELLWC